MKIQIILFSDDEKRLEIEDIPGNRCIKIDELPYSSRDYQGIIHVRDPNESESIIELKSGKISQ